MLFALSQFVRQGTQRCTSKGIKKRAAHDTSTGGLNFLFTSQLLSMTLVMHCVARRGCASSATSYQKEKVKQIRGLHVDFEENEVCKRSVTTCGMVSVSKIYEAICSMLLKRI